MLAFYLSLLEEQSDKELFTEIYQQNIGKMFNIAKAILCSDELANESVHETFLKVIKHFSKFTALGSEHQKGWIVLTTKYTSLNILKKEKRYIPVNDSFLFEVIDKQYDNTTNDIYDDLAEALCELPKIYQDVLELYYVQGYTSKEIAEILNITLENTKQRMSRGRKMLLEILKKY